LITPVFSIYGFAVTRPVEFLLAARTCDGAVYSRAMPELEVQFPQATEILVEPFDPHIHILPDGVLTDDELQRIQQLLYVLTNRSDKAISAMAVLWSDTLPSGRFGKGSNIVDRFSQAIGQHFLLPGGQALMGPGILHSLNDTDPRTGRLNLARIEKADQITLSLDLLIFEDGLVIGPDSAGMVSSVENRKIAIRTVLNEVRSTLAQRSDVNSVLERLRVPPPRPLQAPYPGTVYGVAGKDETAAGWVSRIARQLTLMLRSSDLDTAMSRLETPIPPFYRK
jgi:hypothetical protein